MYLELQVFRVAGLKDDLVKVTEEGVHVLHNSSYSYCKLYFISRCEKIKYCILVIRVSAAMFYFPHTQGRCGNHKTYATMDSFHKWFSLRR